ncbi:MAG: hypothetical protein JW913_15555 [Chitinispirillaceae bacterium]|nr:hypothetical protein [Chitinispirillaceae bacterium]
MMRSRVTTLFSLLFCAMIVSVQVIQIVSDLLQGNRIQAADILEDTFITPHRRERMIAAHARSIIDTLQRCENLIVHAGAADQVYGCAEEALTIAEAMKSRAVEVNRYVADSAAGAVPRFDSLVRCIEALRDAINAGEYDAAARQLKTSRGIAGRIDRDGSGPGTMVRFFRVTARALFRETLFNSRYLRAYEHGIEERSVVAAAIRPVVQTARFALLGDLGTKAIRGKAGWLFYRPDVEYLYRPPVHDARSKSVDGNDTALSDDPVATIVDFKKQLEARGIELMVVIVPGKGSIYPDLITGRVKPGTPLSHSTAIIEMLRQQGVMVIDLFGPFLAERGRDAFAGDSLYLARDTHWKSRGVRLAAQTVAESVRRRPWYNDEHTAAFFSIDTVAVERTGDIGEMTRLPKVRIVGFSTAFAPEVTKCFQVLHNYLDDQGRVLERNRYRDDFRNSRILVLGDSFSRIYQTDDPRGAGWIAHLAFELAEPLASIISDGGASTLVREKLARKVGVLKGKRLVIWEFVERDLRYGESGWQRIALPAE